MAKVVGLLAQWFGRQTVHECNHAMWEIMLGKPTDDHSLLHVRSSCYVQYQVAKLMPVPTTEQTILVHYLQINIKQDDIDYNTADYHRDQQRENF